MYVDIVISNAFNLNYYYYFFSMIAWLRLSHLPLLEQCGSNACVVTPIPPTATIEQCGSSHIFPLRSNVNCSTLSNRSRCQKKFFVWWETRTRDARVSLLPDQPLLHYTSAAVELPSSYYYNLFYNII